MNDNFKQAWREVFSFTKSSGDTSGSEANNDPGKANEEKEPAAPKDDKSYSYKNAPKPKKYDENSTTYITRSTVIKSTIITDSDLKIAGEIEGNVEGRNIAVVGGKIIGDINCTSTEIDNAHIEGNITAAEVVDIGKDNLIIGNITAGRGKVAGKVKGHVMIEQDLEIEAEAVILGDITADLISIKRGAALQGNMTVRREQINSIAQKVHGSPKQKSTDPVD